jgi:hypothetical protein
MAMRPVEYRILFILGAHNVTDPVTWGSLAMLTVLPSAVVSGRWGRLVQHNSKLAELIAVVMTLVGAAIGFVTSGLDGWVWVICFALAYLAMETGSTLMWACAEAEAVKDPNDVRRISLMNGVRYGAGVPVGYLAVIAGSALVGIWGPAVALSAGALVVVLFVRGPTREAS